MKKLTLLAVVLFSLTASTFAIGNRIVELSTTSNVEATNNVFAVKDYLVPELVIDMSDFAKKVPKSGFNATESVSEELAFKIDIPSGPKIGFGLGAEILGSFTASKSLFELLYAGHDFTEEENLVCTIDDTYVDVFAFINASYGMDIGDKITFMVTPTLFSTVAHMGMEDTKVTLTNKNNGDFGFALSGKLSVYAGETLGDDYLALLSSLNNNFGFDLAASGYYKLFDFLDVGGSFRIPIVPSRPKVQSIAAFDCSMMTNVTDLTSGGFSAPAFNMGEWVASEGTYVVNRPMKFAASAVYHPVIGIMPWEDLITCYATLGFGIKHSFTSDAKAYFDYYFGTKFSLWNMLKLTVSAEHLDEIYRNKIEFGFNTRLLEVDTGISSSSKSFAKSFTGAGIGAYVNVALGF